MNSSTGIRNKQSNAAALKGENREMNYSVIKMSCTMIIVFMLTACMGTKMIAGWKDEAYNNKPAKVFVIGISNERGPRSLVEDEFVRLMKERGTEAVASYTVLPDEPKPDKHAVLAKAREAGADVIMVVRYLGKDTDVANTPLQRYGVPSGFATYWDGYYGGVASSVGIRDVSYDQTVISMETTMYQTETGKPIWSALSQTRFDQGGPIKQIKPYAAAIMKELANAKIIQ
jgi:hypothetical protein